MEIKFDEPKMGDLIEIRDAELAKNSILHESIRLVAAGARWQFTQDQAKLAELESQVKSQAIEISHIKIHGNCEHCEPIYGCCTSANGCGCYGWPTDFRTTDKCYEGCSTRLRKEKKELESRLAAAEKVIGNIDHCMTIEIARKLASEYLQKQGVKSDKL